MRPGATDQYYFEHRLREEAEAAATAESVAATVAHVKLAIAYARRFANGSRDHNEVALREWVTQNRVW